MYEPKLNVDALLQGYVGADPKQVGALRGYVAGEQLEQVAQQMNTQNPGSGN